jgi:hypothetical protein
MAHTDRTTPIDPKAQESFLELLRRSGLVEEPLLTQLLDEFANAQAHPFGISITSLTMMFVSRGLLINWQVAKLREGKSKGFYLDHLLVLDYLKSSNEYITYLARDRKRNVLCKVNIFPPKSLDAPRELMKYEVEELESQH